MQSVRLKVVMLKVLVNLGPAPLMQLGSQLGDLIQPAVRETLTSRVRNHWLT